MTILSIDNNLLEVRSTRGDMHLGGEDFDNKLVEYCIKEFKEQTGVDDKLILAFSQKSFNLILAF